MKAATPRQLSILAWATQYYVANGVSPSVREVMTHFDLGSTNAANDHRRALLRKGLVLDAPRGRSRASLLPTHAGHAVLDTLVYLGAPKPRPFVAPEPLDRRPLWTGATAQHAEALRGLLPGEIGWTFAGGAVRVQNARPRSVSP